jgi:hypothetical protein
MRKVGVGAVGSDVGVGWGTGEGGRGGENAGEETVLAAGESLEGISGVERCACWTVMEGFVSW